MHHARSDYNRIQDPLNLIPEDEPVFLLRGQDPDAIDTVRNYAARLEARGGDPEMVKICFDHADAMAAWPVKKTVADLERRPTFSVNSDMSISSDMKAELMVEAAAPVSSLPPVNISGYTDVFLTTENGDVLTTEDGVLITANLPKEDQ